MSLALYEILSLMLCKPKSTFSFVLNYFVKHFSIFEVLTSFQACLDQKKDLTFIQYFKTPPKSVSAQLNLSKISL